MFIQSVKYMYVVHEICIVYTFFCIQYTILGSESGKVTKKEGRLVLYIDLK